MILSKRSVVVLLLASAGCARQAPVASPAVVTRDAREAYQATAPARATCAAAGPFSCDFAPSSGEQLCDQLAKCLATHDPAKASIQVSGCGELGTFETAPAQSGVKRVAVVNVDGTLNGQTGQGSYLVAEREGGFCLVDQAVRWETIAGGYLDTDSRLQWHTDNGKTLLSVRTQAVRFSESDEDEGDAVAGSLCRDAEYTLDGGRFVAVRERAVNEPCSDD